MTSFMPDVGIPQVPMRTHEIIIIGGGIAGASIAYHLAKIGITDIELLVTGNQLLVTQTGIMTKKRMPFCTPNVGS